MVAQVTRVNLGGYLIAFFGVCWYNYKKLQAMQARPFAITIFFCSKGQSRCRTCHACCGVQARQAAAAAQQKADAEGGRMMTNGGGDRAGEKAPLVGPKTG